MLRAWFDLPLWLMFVTLAVFFLATATVLVVATFGRMTRGFAVSLAGISQSYFSVPATLAALLLGFVANETWDRQRHATEVVQSESDNVIAADQLSRVLGQPSIREALRTYLKTVIDDEWPAMADGGSAASTDAAIDSLLRAAAATSTSGAVAPPAQTALLNLILKIRSNRSERLALNHHQTDDTKWLTLLILALLTQVAIAAIHIDRPRAQVATLAIFTVGFVSALGLVAIHEWPFDGPAAIQPIALENAAKRLAIEPAT